MDVYATKCIRGNWRAENIVPLGFDIEGKPAELYVYTSKGSRGTLDTYAGVQTRDNGFTTQRIFRDFSKRVLSTAKRGTEKAVREQQQEAVTLHLDTIKSEALAHHKALGDLSQDQMMVQESHTS